MNLVDALKDTMGHVGITVGEGCGGYDLLLSGRDDDDAGVRRRQDGRAALHATEQCSTATLFGPETRTRPARRAS